MNTPSKAFVVVKQAQLVMLEGGDRAWMWDQTICRVGRRGRLPEETMSLGNGTWLQLWDGSICRAPVAGDPTPGDYLWTGERSVAL